MKKLVLLFTALILGTSGIMANTADDKVAERNAYRNNNSFIFVENGVTFSVYPDGEFDFYIDNRIGNRRKNVTFNSGHDYSAYAQYDDYGAVIQVENVPIYYDNFGRVSQIGDVDLRYRNGRVRSVGNMFVYYNNRGFYDYHTGYINSFNRFYVYRPFHGFFARPSLGFCLVNRNPYRRFYSPIRYTFYNPYRFNRRNTFAKIGREHRYNRVRRERSTIYRNDKRVAQRDNARRSNRTVARSNSNRGNRQVARNNSSRPKRTAIASNSNRGNRNVGRTNRSTTSTRSNGEKRTVKRSDYRKGTGATNRSVTKRQVTRTPRSTTVKRTTVRKPVSRSTNRNVRSTAQRTKRSVARPTQRTSRNTVSRSSASRSVRKAPVRSSRSSNTRSASVRSRGRQ